MRIYIPRMLHGMGRFTPNKHFPFLNVGHYYYGPYIRRIWEYIFFGGVGSDRCDKTLSWDLQSSKETLGWYHFYLLIMIQVILLAGETTC